MKSVVTKSPEQKEYEWREKRHGKITSSTLPDLMKTGKGTPYGKAFFDALYIVRYERRTGVTRDNGTCKAFDWGHENEPLAVEWVRSQLMDEVKSCTTDYEDIVFNEPFAGFGDSPDFYVLNSIGEVKALGEIKCPMNQSKIESLQFFKEITDKDEYYWQFLGHFVGMPTVNTLYYVIYDGYTNTGRIIAMYREEHTDNIQKLTDRIKFSDELVECSLKTGLDLPECIELATVILPLRKQIEELTPQSKRNVPVQNQIRKLKKEVSKTIKAYSQHTINN